RWVKQMAGGHVHSNYLNYIGIGICLVGDFNRDLPTHAQFEALDELIRYLRQRVGKVDGRYSIVLGHKEINPRPTECPGNRFPLHWLHRTFPHEQPTSFAAIENNSCDRRSAKREIRLRLTL